MLTYVINLDRQPARMARMAAQLCGVAFERMPAADGRNLDGLERRAPGMPSRPEELTRSERALILSHKQVWERLVASGEPCCCVLEDDVLLSPDFAELVRDGGWVPAGACIVKIEACSRRKVFLGPQKAEFKGRAILPLLSRHLGTAGYVIGREAARILAGRATAFPHPIDHILFEDLLADGAFKIYQMLPALCIQECRMDAAAPLPPEFQSTIQNSTPKPRVPLRQKLLREIKRPFISLANSAAFVLSGSLAKGNFRRVEYR